MSKNTVGHNHTCEHKKVYDKADKVLEKLPEAVGAIIDVLLLPVGIETGALDKMFDKYKEHLKSIDAVADAVSGKDSSHALSVVARDFLDTLWGIMEDRNEIAIEIDSKPQLDMPGTPLFTGGQAKA